MPGRWGRTDRKSSWSKCATFRLPEPVHFLSLPRRMRPSMMSPGTPEEGKGNVHNERAAGRGKSRVRFGTARGDLRAGRRGHRGPYRIRAGRHRAEPVPPRLQPGEAPDQRFGGVAGWLDTGGELRRLRDANDRIRGRAPFRDTSEPGGRARPRAARTERNRTRDRWGFSLEGRRR